MLNGDIIIARLGLSTLGQTRKNAPPAAIPAREPRGGSPAPAGGSGGATSTHPETRRAGQRFSLGRQGAPPYLTPIRAMRIERSQIGTTTRSDALRDIRKTCVTPTAMST